MRDGLEARYQGALDKSNSEGQIQWARFNAILVVNTIFLAIIGFTYNNNFLPVSRQMLAVLGIVLCFLWFQMTKRGFMWIRFFTTKARKIEEIENKKYSVNPFMEGYEHKQMSDEIFNTRNASFIIIGIFTAIYFFILLSK